jgi:hypothetical protein
LDIFGWYFQLINDPFGDIPVYGNPHLEILKRMGKASQNQSKIITKNLRTSLFLPLLDTNFLALQNCSEVSTHINTNHGQPNIAKIYWIYRFLMLSKIIPFRSSKALSAFQTPPE